MNLCCPWRVVHNEPWQNVAQELRLNDDNHGSSSYLREDQDDRRRTREGEIVFSSGRAPGRTVARGSAGNGGVGGKEEGGAALPPVQLPLVLCFVCGRYTGLSSAGWHIKVEELSNSSCCIVFACRVTRLFCCLLLAGCCLLFFYSRFVCINFSDHRMFMHFDFLKKIVFERLVRSVLSLAKKMAVCLCCCVARWQNPPLCHCQGWQLKGSTLLRPLSHPPLPPQPLLRPPLQLHLKPHPMQLQAPILLLLRIFLLPLRPPKKKTCKTLRLVWKNTTLKRGGCTKRR